MSLDSKSTDEPIEIMSQKPVRRENDNKFDKRWVLTAVIAMAILAIGIMFNSRSNDNNATKIAGLMNVDNGDSKINWNRYDVKSIELDERLTITDSGIYHLSGILDDGSITIDSGIKGEVKIILDNVSISSSLGPAITCVSGDDLVIELIGNNTLQDATTYDGIDQDIAGAIYSKADLTFEGDGTLNLIANYQDAIIGKDDVKFNSGTYYITAPDDGIHGKDSVSIVDGIFNINTRQDGIKSTNDTDTEKGFVLIQGGDIRISSGDDGIYAERALAVQSGMINISRSHEGLEAQKIIINGGHLSIVSSDDGLNASNKQKMASKPTPSTSGADDNCEIIINDGDIYINASGDGIDSNGQIYFNGGSTTIDGPINNNSSALDSNSGIIVNGGTVLAISSSNMIEKFDEASTVLNADIYFEDIKSTGAKFEIKDPTGNTLISHTSAKPFNHAMMSSADFVLGEIYYIYINGEKYQDFTINNSTTTVNKPKNNTTIPGGHN